jgi:hypothetical protein
MARLQAKSVVAAIGVALVMSIGFMPAPAEAARMTKTEKGAWKQANVACKAEAKGKKIRWLGKRKFVKDCLKEALKEQPNIDVDKLMLGVKGKSLPTTPVDSHM